MSNVVRIREHTQQESAVATLEAAKAWDFKSLVVLGFDEDENFMCMTTAELTNKNLLWLIESARNRIFHPE